MTCFATRRRALAALMGFESLTLALVSSLHLSHSLGRGSKPFDPTSAGIAEGLIAVVLAAGAVALVSSAERGRQLALAATGFAIVGFLFGVTFTILGGETIDRAYHAVMLPLLALTFLLIVRTGRRAPPSQIEPSGVQV